MNEKDAREHPGLEELPLEALALSELEPLPDLPGDVAPLAELPDGVEPLPAAATAAAPGQKRTLDRVPLLLRKAAMIVTAGSVLPWASAEALAEGSFAWGASLAAKAILLLSIWLLYQSHVARHGGRVPGALASLARIQIPLGAQRKLQLLSLLAVLVAVVGLLPIEGFTFASLSEKLILLLAGYTFAHIYDYEHGGRFNPLAPMMFFAPALGGLGALFKVFAVNVLAGLGALAVTAGGMLAVVTLGMAMRQAKVEGDAKKAAALEARKAARRTGEGAGKRPVPRPPGSAA